MYLEQGALNHSPLLSSRAIMTRLTQKYKEAASRLCGIDLNNEDNLNADEILMLVRTPSYRLMLEKTYLKLAGRKVAEDSFFKYLNELGVNRESILLASTNSKCDLILPPPFLTSIINPDLNTNNRVHDPSSVICEIYKTYPYFSGTSSLWKIKKPTVTDINQLMTAVIELGKISLEPVEDIAFNVRFVAVVEPRQKQLDDIFGASYSHQVLPGIIFLGGSFLEDPASLIESLYHESLHSKLVNTYRAYKLLKIESLSTNTDKFTCPWATSEEQRQWPFRRTAAAYHVYCHLLAFHRLVIKRRGRYYEWSNKRIPVIREKLQILNEYIKRTQTKMLTESGIQYFNLLINISEM